MGRDKAEIFWQGEPLWQRQYRILSAICSPVWRSVRYDVSPEHDLMVDSSPFPGPAPALVHALSTMPGNWLLVLAVDLLRIDQELLKSVVAARINDGVTVAVSADRPQPLLSIWHRTLVSKLPSAEELVGASVQSLMAKIPTSAYRLPPERSHLLVNVNTPEDLEAELK